MAGVFEVLEEINYSGRVMVELDGTPKARAGRARPLQIAAYLESWAIVRVGET